MWVSSETDSGSSEHKLNSASELGLPGEVTYSEGDHVYVQRKNKFGPSSIRAINAKEPWALLLDINNGDRKCLQRMLALHT